ncbi:MULTISPECIES: RNA polymerase sigma factor [unclassified Aureimonas]|uniref:RNA polymerase sigma factor n=1 Tax=unclassified Aureimonas TaxID=2615206 RepID=UPI0006FB2253|nr:MULTISPECIES: sigma-70 family RNA polymerase sigma factor [unclassified Aureimonas]KQT60720.1 RNA polymerase subunit sigma-70 [Aureimonas sp. Leaf460]KQT68849.1 RNA polymerase subunit sigma-70 [Aureimonas sp. Leaf427]
MTDVMSTHFRSHSRSLLWRVLRIVRDSHAAEDLIQDAYLKVHQACHTRPVEHIEAYLNQTARNLAVDHCRRQKREGVVESCDTAILERVEAEGPSAETAMIHKERLASFEAALAGLPQRARQVLELSRVEDWSNVRIAAHLGISERTVFNDLKLALGHCRDAMTRAEGR